MSHYYYYYHHQPFNSYVKTSKFRECIFALIFYLRQKSWIVVFYNIMNQNKLLLRLRNSTKKLRIRFFSTKFHDFQLLSEITREIMQFTNNFLSFRVISYHNRWHEVAILKCKKMRIDIYRFSYAHYIDLYSELTIVDSVLQD